MPKRVKKKAKLTADEIKQMKKIDTMWIKVGNFLLHYDLTVVLGQRCWIEMITNDDLGKIKEKDEEQPVFAKGQITKMMLDQYKVEVAYEKDGPAHDPEKYIN